MTFTVDKEIFTQFPDVRIGCLLLTNFNNAADESTALIKKIVDKSEEISKEFDVETITKVPFIERWREIYRKFGAKPSDYRSSIENLIRMILKGRILGHINTLVDIYNFISLKYKLPIGGEDIDAIKGELRLTIANGNENAVKLLGDQKAEKPFPGEILYRDDEDVICRCWNWREAERTMLTKQTKNAIIVIETTDSSEYEALDAALDGMTTMATHFLGGNVKRGVLNKDSPSVSF